jgi:hypothetical protein
MPDRWWTNKNWYREKQVFGEHWVGGTPESHEETLIALYRSEPKSDGQSVAVYCMSMPARFYKLEVRAGYNSVGELKDGYEVSFGTIDCEFVARLAKEISEGMVGFRPLK